jgi:hypothetical protein
MTSDPRPSKQCQEAYRKVDELVRTLRRLTERDPDQEVQGIAVPVLDAVIALARTCVPDDPVVSRMEDAVSPRLVIEDDPVRAADALVAAEQLRVALHKFMPLPGV